jgi:hypothetical protein
MQPVFWASAAGKHAAITFGAVTSGLPLTRIQHSISQEHGYEFSATNLRYGLAWFSPVGGSVSPLGGR